MSPVSASLPGHDGASPTPLSVECFSRRATRPITKSDAWVSSVQLISRVNVGSEPLAGGELVLPDPSIAR